MIDLQTHIGQRMRRRRKLLCMTQEELGVIIGTRHQQINKYETAVNHMTAERLWQVAQALQVPVGFFFEGLEQQVAA